MQKRFLKGLIFFLFLSGVGVFTFFDLGGYLTLDQLKETRDELQAWVQTHPYISVGGYFALYVLVTGLSLPGAAVLTLAGGALFGLWTGTLLVSFASTLGATLAFLIARFLLRDWVEGRFKDRFERINEGVKKEGAFYLFTLRLVPLFPFFLINLVMGLTGIRTLTFFVVSQVGMLPGTAVFVNAGTQLAQIESLGEIFSPSIIFSFALIGVFPLLSRWAIRFFKSRNALRAYRKPKSFDYNLIVVGAGSGGLVSSYIAAAVKAKVVLIEKNKMGGDCLNTGCVPSKALIRSSKILSYFKNAQKYGIKNAEVDFDFADVMDRVRRVIGKIEPHDSVERYTKLGVECIQGEAKILDPYTVEVNGKKLTARNLIISTGAAPFAPPIPGLNEVGYRTSDTIWELRELPNRLVVLGGGPIGCELAQSFQRFGAQVIQVEMGPRLMGKEDNEVSEWVKNKFESEGVRVLTSHNAKSFRREGEKKILVCESENGPVEIEFDELLLALGRRANTKGFGLEELGVEIAKNGTIAHDPFLRTNFPNIYVVGDVAGPFQFTHAAAHQAWFATVNALFSPVKSFKVDYQVIPWATFTDPEVAHVGLNEQDAQEKGIDFEVTRYDLSDLDRAITEEEDHGFIKVITPKGKDQILGVTIVGAHAGDLIAEFVTAMKHGLGLNKILGTIHIYPTFAEMNKFAAGNWKKAHAPEKVLEFLKKFHGWRRGAKKAVLADLSNDAHKA
jgi:dihydrolipoamide dehydrogenase